MPDYCEVGGFNCKYCYKDVCDFFAMGSGEPNDMPCISNATESESDGIIKISKAELSDVIDNCIENVDDISLYTKSVLYDLGKQIVDYLSEHYMKGDSDAEE